MTHAAVAVAAALLCVLIGWPPWAGAVAAGALYAGREHSQAEHRIINSHYGGRRADAPLWAGFHPAAWNRDALADLLLPIATGSAVAALF